MRLFSKYVYLTPNFLAYCYASAFGVMMKSEPPGQFNRGWTQTRGRFTSLEPEPSNFYPVLHTCKCTHYEVMSEEICWHDIIDHLMDKQIVLHKLTDAEDEDFAHA